MSSSLFLAPPLPSFRYSPPLFRSPPRCKLSIRALGVDYGLRRIGLAVSVGISPRVLAPVLHHNTPTEAARKTAEIATQNLCDAIVVGQPLDVYGKRGEQVEATELFVGELIKEANWALIWMVDERYSSSEAREVIKGGGKGGEDGVAAAILLERFFGNEGGVLVHEGTGGGWGEKVEVQKVEGFREWKRRIMEEVEKGEAGEG